MKVYLKPLVVMMWLSNLYLFSQSPLPKGIHANVSFIETESGHFQGETFEDLLNSVEFSLGNLTEKKNKI